MDANQWAGILGCKVGVLPINYLGANIGTNPRRKIFWKSLIERFEKKLAGWKGNSYNQAGRRVLVKACLNSLPTYWFHLHKVPASIISSLEKN